jgi:hypothetical protein
MEQCDRCDIKTTKSILPILGPRIPKQTFSSLKNQMQNVDGHKRAKVQSTEYQDSIHCGESAVAEKILH